MVITSEQKTRILAAMDGGATRLDVNNNVIFTHSISSIVSADEFIASFNRKLNGHGKWMCKHGSVLDAEQRCECSPESRITNTSGLITTVDTIECPQCHVLCRVGHEFCDTCDTPLFTKSQGELTGPVSLKEAVSMLPQQS